jgi:hypothetical protein
MFAQTERNPLDQPPPWPRGRYVAAAIAFLLGAAILTLGHLVDVRPIQFLGFAIAFAGFVSIWLRILYLWFFRVAGRGGACVGALLAGSGLVAAFGGGLLQDVGLARSGRALEYGGHVALVLMAIFAVLAFARAVYVAIRTGLR